MLNRLFNDLFWINVHSIYLLPQYNHSFRISFTISVHTPEPLNQCIDWCGFAYADIIIQIQTDLNHLSRDKDFWLLIQDHILQIAPVSLSKARMNQYWRINTILPLLDSINNIFIDALRSRNVVTDDQQFFA